MASDSQRLEDLEPSDSDFDAEYDLPPEPPAKPAAKSRAAESDSGDETAKKPTPKHPVALAHQARQLGFSQAEIDGADTAELRAAVAEERTRRLEEERETLLRASGSPPEKAEPEPDEFAELEKEFDPRIVAHLKKMAEAQKALAKENEELKAGLTRRDRAANVEKLDDAFAALGEDYHAHFGGGAAGEYGKDSAEMQNRLIVLRAAGIDITQPLPSAAAVKAAVAKVVSLMGSLGGGKAKKAAQDDEPDAYSDAAEAALADRKAKFTQGGLAQPTHRKPPPPSKRPEAIRKRALAAIAERQKLNGTKAQYDESEEDSLPD